MQSSGNELTALNDVFADLCSFHRGLSMGALDHLAPSGSPGTDGATNFVMGSWVILVGDKVASFGR